jgi:hypothetical protein
MNAIVLNARPATREGACAPDALQLLADISSARSLAQLEGFSRAIWEHWAAGRLSDAQAQSLAESVEQRRRHVRGVDVLRVRAPNVAAAAKQRGQASYFPPKRKAVVSPDRQASLARRRRLAASGPMPPQLACRFTVGELAALRIVADEARDKGSCRLCLAEIAARAGVGVTTARNGLRYAARQGLVTIEERRRDKRPNLPNIVRIISRDWCAWIGRSGRRSHLPKDGTPAAACANRLPSRFSSTQSVRADFSARGSKKKESTDKSSTRTLHSDRSSSDHSSSSLAPFKK